MVILPSASEGAGARRPWPLSNSREGRTVEATGVATLASLDERSIRATVKAVTLQLGRDKAPDALRGGRRVSGVRPLPLRSKWPAAHVGAGARAAAHRPRSCYSRRVTKLPCSRALAHEVPGFRVSETHHARGDLGAHAHAAPGFACSSAAASPRFAADAPPSFAAASSSCDPRATSTPITSRPAAPPA